MAYRLAARASSAIAYQQARIEQAGAQAILGAALEPREIELSTAKALDELSKVNRAELADEDFSAYNDATMRVSASRWVMNPTTPRSIEVSKLAALSRQG